MFKKTLKNRRMFTFIFKVITLAKKSKNLPDPLEVNEHRGTDTDKYYAPLKLLFNI